MASDVLLLDAYVVIHAVVNIEVYRKESDQDAQALTVAEWHPAVSRPFSLSAVNVSVELRKCTGPISKALIPSSLARDFWALSLLSKSVGCCGPSITRPEPTSRAECCSTLKSAVSRTF